MNQIDNFESDVKSAAASALNNSELNAVLPENAAEILKSVIAEAIARAITVYHEKTKKK